jgi:predicted acylesterase/phospholipase RssA
MKISNIKHLVLSGGGMLGISYIGLLKYLEDILPNPITNNLQSITGCSAGAIFATFISIGYTSVELNIIVKKMNFKEYLNINAESILNFMKLKGLESGKNLINFIKNCIKDKTGNEDITFKEIKERFNVELQIGVTNLTKYKFELMNSINTPDIPIHKAISASIAIPFVFEPIVIGDDLYCDGGILNNLPIESLIIHDNKLPIEKHIDKHADKKDDTNNDDTNNDESKTEIKEDNESDTKEDTKEVTEPTSILAIYLLTNVNSINKDNYQSIPISQYINSIIHSLSYEFVNHKIQINNMINKENEKCKIIIYNIPCDIMTFLKINSSHEDIDNIIEIAYRTTYEAFTRASAPRAPFTRASAPRAPL